MNSSQTVYCTSPSVQQETVSPFQPLPRYLEWQHDDRVIADLLEEIAYLEKRVEVLKGFRLEYRDNKPNFDFIEVRLKPLLETVEHRKRLLQRYRNDPLAPSWPHGSGKVGRLASDLREFWPLPKFCREMLLMDLQGRGDQLRARCPAPSHNDRTPSFVIYTRDDRWHCFGACDCGGDIFDLIKVIYGHQDFTPQVRMLADATGHDMAASR